MNRKSQTPCSDFDLWWNDEGRGMLVDVSRLALAQMKNIKLACSIAWQNGAYKNEHPTSPNATHECLAKGDVE